MIREDASLTCNGYGGHLVTISKCDELYHLSRILNDIDIGYYWIGLQRQKADDPFKWEDGHKSAFRSWAYQQPKTDLCARATERVGMDQWYAVSCSQEHEAICKLKGKCFLNLNLL